MKMNVYYMVFNLLGAHMFFVDDSSIYSKARVEGAMQILNFLNACLRESIRIKD